MCELRSVSSSTRAVRSPDLRRRGRPALRRSSPPGRARTPSRAPALISTLRTKAPPESAMTRAAIAMNGVLRHELDADRAQLGVLGLEAARDFLPLQEPRILLAQRGVLAVDVDDVLDRADDAGDRGRIGCADDLEDRRQRVGDDARTPSIEQRRRPCRARSAAPKRRQEGGSASRCAAALTGRRNSHPKCRVLAVAQTAIRRPPVRRIGRTQIPCNRSNTC